MAQQPWASAPRWTFGDRVRRIRRDHKMTQAEFAVRLGVGDRSVAAWESDRNEPEQIVEMARRIEGAFGVPAAWVLGIAEGPHPGGGGGLHAVERAGRARRDSNPQPSDPKVRVRLPLAA